MFYSKARAIRDVGRALREDQRGYDDWGYWANNGEIANFGSHVVKTKIQYLEKETERLREINKALLDHLNLEVLEGTTLRKKK